MSLVVSYGTPTGQLNAKTDFGSNSTTSTTRTARDPRAPPAPPGRPNVLVWPPVAVPPTSASGLALRRMRLPEVEARVTIYAGPGQEFEN